MCKFKEIKVKVRLIEKNITRALLLYAVVFNINRVGQTGIYQSRSSLTAFFLVFPSGTIIFFVTFVGSRDTRSIIARKFSFWITFWKDDSKNSDENENLSLKCEKTKHEGDIEIFFFNFAFFSSFWNTITLNIPQKVWYRSENANNVAFVKRDGI